MFKVIVLMSTYNGDRYLKEQLDSVFSQKEVDVYVMVRDDGSSDNTLGILEEYSRKYKNLSYYTGKNLKPTQSFFDLLNSAPDAEYYAFCDQDDVWDEDKLISACKMLSEYDSSLPLLYYCNLRIVDENLQFYRVSHVKTQVHSSRYGCLVDNMVTGCTMVINKSTRDKVKNRIPEYCSMHDAWLYMVCTFFGKTVYDKHPHIQYRQHGDNVVGTALKKHSIRRYMSSFLRLFNRNLQPRYNDAVSLLNIYEDELLPEDKEKIMLVAHYKDNLINRLRLLFSREIRSNLLYREIRYRILVLLGIA